MASLSVVLCNYNHAHYLNDTLREILAQSRPPDEFIIIDDGSTDNSRDIISSFRDRHHNVRAIFNEQNCGVTPNANHGLHIASGDYIYFAAADDRVLPGFFARAMVAAEENPQAGCVISDRVYFDQSGAAWTRPIPLGRQTRVLSPRDVVIAQMTAGFLVPGHASILRRRAALEAGGQISALEWHADWFMNHVIALREGLVYLPLPLAAMRLSTLSYSGRSRSWSLQRTVFRTLMDLLHSPAYADVANAFAEAGILIQLGPRVGRYSREDDRVADFLTLQARRRLLAAAIRQRLAQALPTAVQRRLKKLLSLEPPSYIMPQV